MRMKASPRHNCNWQHVVAKDIIDPKHVMEKKIYIRQSRVVCGFRKSGKGKGRVAYGIQR
jgi:hypothetical protein